MRIASVSLIVTVSLFPLACGDDGKAVTDGSTTNPPGVTLNPTMATDNPTEIGAESSSSGTGGSGTDTANTPTTGDSTTVEPTTQGIDSTTGEPETSTTLDPSNTTGDTPCEEIKATLKPLEPNIMLVLDKSGSMVSMETGFWDHDADPATPNITRWNSLYAVVQNITTEYNDTINFGANLFPSTKAIKKYDESACVVSPNVEIPVKPKNKDAILNGIPQAGQTNLYGGTPAAAGVQAALNHLKTLDPTVPRAMLLVTDGAANCTAGAPNPTALFENYDQSLHTLVQQAFMVDQIPTYVVGIDTKDSVSDNSPDGNPNQTNTYAKLNELALDGGKPKDDPTEKFYNAVNQLQLKEALDVIAADALSCSIPLTSEPGFPMSTKVKVGAMEYPMVTDCATEDGWVYDNPMGPYTAVILCGAACEALKVEKAADVEYYCTAG